MGNNKMVNQNSINQYCSYFEGQIIKVSTVEDRLYREILFVTMFDAWSRVRYPTIKTNKERFINLIKVCSNWNDCNRISTPQLLLALQTKPVVVCGKLKNEVDSRMEKWQKSSIYRLDIDPWLQDIMTFAVNKNEKKLVNSATHANLLYIYRNHVVHEFGEPGHGNEISNDNTAPYYHNTIDYDTIDNDAIDNDTWELVYPAEFLMRIAKSTLLNIKKYLQDNNLDPYSFYEFSTLWYHPKNNRPRGHRQGRADSGP